MGYNQNVEKFKVIHIKNTFDKIINDLCAKRGNSAKSKRLYFARLDTVELTKGYRN